MSRGKSVKGCLGGRPGDSEDGLIHPPHYSILALATDAAAGRPRDIGSSGRPRRRTAADLLLLQDGGPIFLQAGPNSVIARDTPRPLLPMVRSVAAPIRTRRRRRRRRRRRCRATQCPLGPSSPPAPQPTARAQGRWEKAAKRPPAPALGALDLRLFLRPRQRRPLPTHAFTAAASCGASPAAVPPPALRRGRAALRRRGWQRRGASTVRATGVASVRILGWRRGRALGRASLAARQLSPRLTPPLPPPPPAKRGAHPAGGRIAEDGATQAGGRPFSASDLFFASSFLLLFFSLLCPFTLSLPSGGRNLRDCISGGARNTLASPPQRPISPALPREPHDDDTQPRSAAPLSGFLSAAAGVGQSGQLKAKQRALPSATLGTGERHRRNDPRRPGVTRGRRSAALKAARPLHAHTHAGWCASGRGVHATATLQECNKVSKRASAGM